MQSGKKYSFANISLILKLLTVCAGILHFSLFLNSICSQATRKFSVKKRIALFVLIYRVSISHWPTNGDSFYRGMEILFVGRLCPLQFPGLFPFFVYFLFLRSFSLSLSFFTFVFTRASLRPSGEIDVSAARYSRYSIFQDGTRP